jgi:hypothetical protein
MKLRCCHDGCGGVVGAVWGVPVQWQGRPIVWAETHEVRDPSGPPRVRVWHMILDAITADFWVRSECPGHGWRQIPTQEVVDRLRSAADALSKTGSSLSICMSEPAPATAHHVDRPDFDSRERRAHLVQVDRLVREAQERSSLED